MTKKKLDLRTKQFIAKKIVKYKMAKRTVIENNTMVAIPDTYDDDGKPMFVSTIQFNKIHSFAQRFIK